MDRTSARPAPPPVPAYARAAQQFGKPLSGWRLTLYTIIFEADTRAGRAFDLAVIGAILASVLVAILDSTHAISDRWGGWLYGAEWFFTLLFTAEYVARLLCVRRPGRYALSFFGVIDLLSILPTYIAVLVPGAHVLIDVRVLRLLRVFRILRLTAYVAEFSALGAALRASYRKIAVFLSFVLMLILVFGSVMYVIEGPDNGFTSIPVAMYWAVTTVTTVGFGDITPKTELGRLISSVMMLLGWGVLAVPTGIVTAEMTAQRRGWPGAVTTRTCQFCLTEGHSPEANFCRHCGAKLPDWHHDTVAGGEG
ncbi:MULTISPECIES: ion transporter [Derxia]|uniref:Ion transporter n=1 Tax=Derxia gummosa DSM 723 TaxID=1121388 RepID=A0A8B6X7K1_9BURK|nr:MULTISPECIES: ion transporter [Derxia]